MANDDPFGAEQMGDNNNNNNIDENETSNIIVNNNAPTKRLEVDGDDEGNDHAEEEEEEEEEEENGGKQSQQQQQQQQRDNPRRTNSTNSANNNNDDDDSTSVQVAVRIRPLLAMEGDSDECIRVISDNTALQFGSSGPRFTFDYVFEKQTTQKLFYDKRVTQLVDSCLEGYNATVLAYGQTGSGKTYTILGEDTHHCTEDASIQDDNGSGVLPRAIRDIFQRLNQVRHEQQLQQQQGSTTITTGRKRPRPLSSSTSTDTAGSGVVLSGNSDEDCSSSSTSDEDDIDGNFSFQVKIQFLELYGEEIRDLLATHTMTTTNTGNTTKLTIRDTTALTDEPEVVGATQMNVESAQDALEALQKGMVRRVTGATAMNQTSSRSHAILSVMIEQRQRQVTTTAAASAEDQQQDPQQETPAATSLVQVKRSKFNFVDLAGSERQKKTRAEGKRLREGININQGLLVLGNVISALGDLSKKGSFVPYRDSKLTRLLKGSLGGNHKTLMIACVSPSSSNMEETLNCLRYANRAKNIQNRAVVNVDENSRLVSQLQGQVQVLASELLRAWDGENIPPPHGPVTRETVEALVSGKKDASSSFQMQSALSPSPHSRQRTITPDSAGAANASTNRNQDTTPRLREMELELGRTRDKLRQIQTNHDASEEELYAAKAENQLYQLQLSVLSSSPTKSSAAGVGNNSDTSPSAVNTVTQKGFLERVTQYETEIGRLKQALREAEVKSSHMASWGDNVDGLHEDESIERAKKALEIDRQRLAQIHSNLSSNSPSKGELEALQQQTPGDGNDNDDDAASSGSIDQQEKAEQAQLNILTKKYLGDDHDSDEADESHHRDDGNDDNADVEVASHDAASASPSSPLPIRRQRHLQSDLVELARNIAAKEDLIDQLRLSQEKYSSMRDFYEEKLKQMESTLSEKEAEREQLVEQLKRSKETDEGKKLLRDRLKEKETHIASLRKKQKELSELTLVSSRNHAEISRLQSEVKTMKRRKVDVQKQLGQERKHHAMEKRKLEKTALQKDREANKWKNVSTKREVQAEKANQVAKCRLEEIGHLRAKYKDAEKRLRLLSLKRGVMAKAGLDPVMVGRREGKRDNRSKKSTPTSNQTANADLMRDYFDEKVAEVVRKEAIADKLAREWEEHFELTSKKEEIIEVGDDGFDEEVQSLNLQLQFKEDRIRTLAQRLGKHHREQQAPKSKKDMFLFDEEYKNFCSGFPPETSQSQEITAKVLFGMVVRERRRITSLARTASALDERALAAEKAAETNEEALRSYMNEQRRELESLTQTQHEQILSLMDLVKDAPGDKNISSGSAETSSEQPTANGSHDPKLLVLANERVSLLEQQLESLRSEVQKVDSYRDQVDELNTAVKARNEENEDLQEEISGMRGVFRQIRELIINDEYGDIAESGRTNSAVLEIINDALHPKQSPGKKPKSRNRTPSSGSRSLTPRVKKHVELMHTSDSGEDGDAPAWAAEIMADLALIAKGEMPPSLEPVLEENMTSAPITFPSSEKNSREDNSKRPKKGEIRHAASSPLPQGKAERRAMSKEITARLDKIVIPGSKAEGEGQSIITPLADDQQTPSDASYKSVFERLGSPSQYTGTQKGRYQSKQAKNKSRAPKDAATKLLDDLLQSDNEAVAGVAESKLPAGERGASSKTYSDYTQLDVFERLQRTTTQAYAVKHIPETNRSEEKEHASAPPTAHANRNTTNNRDSSEKGGSASAPPPTPTPVPERSRYTSQDVFERLQKTTTEAYAKKTTSLARHEYKP